MSPRRDHRSADASVASEPVYTTPRANRDARVRRQAFAWAPSLPVRFPALLWLVPLTLAAVYLVMFAAQVPGHLTQLSWNPSVASAYVIPETVSKTGTGGFTLLGSTGLWVALWFGLLTARLPLHRGLWGITPTLLFLFTALIVGWSVAQLANRRAAVLAVLISVVASPLAVAFFMAPWAHNTVYPCTALLGAYLVWLTRARAQRRLLALAVAPLAGIVIGVCLASDFLLAATGVIPLTLTAILAGLRRERRSRLIAVSALSTVAVAIPISKLTSTTMGSLGYRTLPTPIKIASLSELPARAKLLFKGLKNLFNGYLGPEAPGTLHSALGLASDIVMSAALLVLVIIAIRTTVQFVTSGLRKSAALTPSQHARSLHVIYWVSSAGIACGAFWIAGEGPVTTHESYYATVIFSVAAVIPLLLSARSIARWLIPAGASILFAGSLVGLSTGKLNLDYTLASRAPRIMRIAQANHATVGYAEWAIASGLTWGTDNRLTVRPVIPCRNPEGVELCGGFQALVPSWYVPQQRRTFLLVEANGAELNSLPAGLGKPLATYAVDATMEMYIYPYDISSQFGPITD